MTAQIIPFPVRNPAEARDPDFRCPTLREFTRTLTPSELCELQGFPAQHGDRGPCGDGDDAA